MSLNLIRPTSAAPAASTRPVNAPASAPINVATSPVNVASVSPEPVNPNLPVVHKGAEETAVARTSNVMKMGQVSGVPDEGKYIAPFLTLLDPNSKFCKKDIKNMALAGNWLYDNEVPFGTELSIIPMAIRCFIVESAKYDPNAPEESAQSPKREWESEALAIADGYVRHDSQSEKWSNLLYTNAVTMMCAVKAPAGLEANAPLKVDMADGTVQTFYPAVVNVRKTKAGPVAKIAREWLTTGGSVPLFANMWVLSSEYKDKPVRYLTTKVTKLGTTPKEVYERLLTLQNVG